jgi:hypothetical protein
MNRPNAAMSTMAERAIAARAAEQAARAAGRRLGPARAFAIGFAIGLGLWALAGFLAWLAAR